MCKLFSGFWISVFANLYTQIVLYVVFVLTSTVFFVVSGEETRLALKAGLTSILVGIPFALFVIRVSIKNQESDPKLSPSLGIPEDLIVDLEVLAQEEFRRRNRILREITHRFTVISATYKIVGQDETFSVLYKGRNTRRKPSTGVTRMVSADSAVDGDKLQFELTGIKPEGITWEFLERSSSPFGKTFHVSFPSPLQKNEEFEFKINCHWPGTCCRTDDYAFFPVNQFRRGIDLLTLEVCLANRPTRYHGVEYKRGRYRIAKQQPILKELKSKTESGWSISVTLHRPRYLYVIWFIRSDI